jgi:hypothetical protein
VLKGFTQATLLGVRISPRYETITYSETQQFSAAGGLAPYTFSKVVGTGSITVGGLFTPDTSGAAPDAPLSTVIRVTDANLETSDTLIYTTSDLAITPSIAQEIYYGNTVDFDPVGGVGPYNFTETGPGSVDPGTGVYTAPVAGGTQTSTVSVEDAESFTADSAVITVYPTFSVSPSGPLTIEAGTTQTFTATGGKSPIVWSIQSGGGSINSSTGLYTAPATNTVAVVRGTDALGTSQDVTVNVLFDIISLLGDGINDYVEATNYISSVDFNWNQPFSLSCWSKGDVPLISITSDESWIDWVDDDGSWSAQVPLGDYDTYIEFLTALETVMNATNPLSPKSIDYNPGTERVTVYSSSSTLFSILWNTGAHAPNSVAYLLGFNFSPDSTGNTGAVGYTSDFNVIIEYTRQTFMSNIDGNVFVGGYAFLTSPYEISTQTYKFDFLIVEDLNVNQALAVRSQDFFTIEGWNHYCVTYDGTGTPAGIKLYRNGIHFPHDIDVDALTGVSTQSAHKMWIGAIEGLSNYTGGWLDEAAFFDVELSLSEVQEIYNSGIPIDLNSHSQAANMPIWVRPEGIVGSIIPNSADAGSPSETFELKNGMATDTDVPT